MTAREVAAVSGGDAASRRGLRREGDPATSGCMKRLSIGLIVACVSACTGNVSENVSPMAPAGPVTFVLRNPTSAPVYFAWVGQRPELDIEHQGQHLAMTRGCRMLCDEGCECMDCDAAPPIVRRLAPGDQHTFEWSGEWFELLACGTCGCVRPRSAMPGDYDIAVAGARGYQSHGGTGAWNGDLLTNASLDPASSACQATFESALVEGAQTVTLTFVCEQ